MTKKPDPTNAARQAGFRARKAAAGLAEVRGIYATAAEAAKIKAYAARQAAMRGAR